MGPPNKVKFDDLVKLEPELGPIETAIRAVVLVPNFCANSVWYGYEGLGFKERMSKLVGHCRGIIPGTGIAATGKKMFYTMRELMDDPQQKTPATTEEERYLRSSDAYDVAYDHLYKLLPDCQAGCVCMATFEALTGMTINVVDASKAGQG